METDNEHAFDTNEDRSQGIVEKCVHLVENGNLAECMTEQDNLINSNSSVNSKLVAATLAANSTFTEDKLAEASRLTNSNEAYVTGKKTFDGLLIHHLGQFGRFQWFLFLSLAVAAVAATWHNLIHVFTGAVPNFQCTHLVHRLTTNLTSGTSNNSVQSYNTLENLEGSTDYDYLGYPDTNTSQVTVDQCNRVIDNTSTTVPCLQWIYDTSQYKSSIVTEVSVCFHTYN
jgi:hypothetical protein